MSGPAAGWYDPIPATIYSMVDGTSSGEPLETPQTYCVRHIRFLSSVSREGFFQNQQTGTVVPIIRLRRDSVTEAITAKMILIHRGNTYEIVGRNDPSNSKAEIELVVKQGDR